MAAFDYTATGNPDILHLNTDTSPNQIYYYDVLNDTTGAVTDDSGTTLTSFDAVGVR